MKCNANMKVIILAILALTAVSAAGASFPLSLFEDGDHLNSGFSSNVGGSGSCLTAITRCRDVLFDAIADDGATPSKLLSMIECAQRDDLCECFGPIAKDVKSDGQVSKTLSQLCSMSMKDVIKDFAPIGNSTAEFKGKGDVCCGKNSCCAGSCVHGINKCVGLCTICI